jgi:hypothetical protein
MSEIRPLAREELPAVVALHEREARSRGASLPPGLERHLDRLFFDSPWFDPELAPLAHVEDDGTISAFVGSSARRFLWQDRPVRVRVSSHLLADAEARKRAAGLRLLRAMLQGPQDLTVTDSANADALRLWAALGGSTAHVSCMAWIRVFEPWRFGRAFLGWRHRRALATAAAPFARPLDALTTRLASRAFRGPCSQARTRTLDGASFVEAFGAVGAAFDFRPAYEDTAFASWLLASLEATWGPERISGSLVSVEGRPVGAFVYALKPGRVAETVHVSAAPRDVGVVLDALFAEARGRRLVAVQGRLEPHLCRALFEHPCVLHRSGASVLVHAREPDLLGAVLAGRAALTRLDADWWMYGPAWDLPVGADAAG